MTEIYENSVISEFPERERGALGEEGGCVVRPLRQHGEVGGGSGINPWGGFGCDAMPGPQRDPSVRTRCRGRISMRFLFSEKLDTARCKCDFVSILTVFFCF